MNNREFLFLYDAALCNPNGDPDQENKPRMDRATKTNLVSSFRIKRYIRDYLIDNETNGSIDVFVRQMGEQKISVETRLSEEIGKLKHDNEMFNLLSNNNKELKDLIQEYRKTIISLADKSDFEIFVADMEDKIVSKQTKENADQKKTEELFIKNHKGYINNAVLTALVKSKFIDIRYFGGTFAVKGFSKTFTGAIQFNMGYSLHPVETTSNGLSTIMPAKKEDDGNNMLGRFENLKYSLIGFTGTINAKKADINGLKNEDLPLFRASMIKSIYETRTESKKNQYPRFYIEIEYKGDNEKKETYGRLGDLRNHVKIESIAKGALDINDFTKVVSLNDISIDFIPLFSKIHLIEDKIEKILIWKSIDDAFIGIKEKLIDSGIPNEKIEELTI
jgi:CRISPR-associated protein Csh2